VKAPGGSCVLGFAPHSGWAAVVVIGGTAARPLVLARERLELADPNLSRSKQPYHAIEGLPLKEADARLALMKAASARLAASGIRTLAHTARAAGLDLLGAGILDSSGRGGAPLEAILASHALIHTADGNHFREALEAGCAAQGLAVCRIRQRDLAEQASRELKRAAEELRATVAQLGREVGAPWGADQKGAALLAWLLLARPQGFAAEAKRA
jgi:hypothetical protein